MPLISFKSQFADFVESGQKTQTVRPFRKRAIIPGDRLYMYSGPWRKEGRRKLGEGICTRVFPLWLKPNVKRLWVKESIPPGGRIYSGQYWPWVELAGDEAEQFARDDGFPSFEAFLRFFRKVHGDTDFEGVTIQWKLIKPGAE